MIYLFKNPNTEEVIEIEQNMNDPHKFIDNNGLEWDRIFTIPHAFITEKVDPYSANQFMNKTQSNGQKLGDLYERSKELSEIRAEKNGGVDPLKLKSEEAYSAKRKGRKIPKKLSDLDLTIRKK